jgi:hypothetical protein
MKMRNERPDIRQLEEELRNAHYRYKLALRDGAVDSIVREIVGRILWLEEELKERRTLVKDRRILSRS